MTIDPFSNPWPGCCVSAGYEAGTFVSAQEFLGSLATSQPECLVLDFQMPEMSGLELQSRLQDVGHPVPIIFITAHDTPQIRAAALQKGPTALLFKPFSTAALLKAIRDAVSCQSQEAALGGL